MTFAQLHAMVRREIIVDAYEDAFTNSDVDDSLWKASVEIAAALDFPRLVYVTPAITPGDTIVVLPVDCARIHSITIRGDDARSAELSDVLRMRATGPGPLRYFNFDPRRGAAVEIAPPSFGGAATIEYTVILERPLPVAFAASEPWNGTLRSFHSIIAYRAAVSLFQMDERENEVDHWRQEYQARLAEISAFLGRTDIGNLLIERELRNDGGAKG